MGIILHVAVLAIAVFIGVSLVNVLKKGKSDKQDGDRGSKGK